MHDEFFQILKKDHDEVKNILQQLKNTTERASKKREDLFGKLKEEILPHMEAEERAFYEPLKKKKEARDQAMEAIEEHRVSEMLLTDLDGLDKTRENWGAKLSVLKEIIEHHIEEEESEVFEIAKKALNEQQMQSILQNFQEAKEKAQATVA